MPRPKEFPPNAKRVFQGKIFEIWQWRQKMFDGSTAIFERAKYPDGVRVIAAVKNKILLQIQRQPDRHASFLSLPGGGCEQNEKPLIAAKRELLEETGYASSHWFLYKRFKRPSKAIHTIHTYIARDCFYKEAPRLDAGEKITTRLISFEEFLLLSEHRNFYQKELNETLLRARFDKKFRAEFHRFLFKK